MRHWMRRWIAYQLLRLLTWIDPGRLPEIVMGLAGQIAGDILRQHGINIVMAEVTPEQLAAMTRDPSDLPTTIH